MALAVTGMGGLAMVGGMLILGRIVGSYDLSVILENREMIQASPLYVPALLLILLGCFTKSAQFPFHFWLPHAMAAPTPVSAYLHSATMVKAGIFLMARMWPVLSGTPEWFMIVTTAGLVTMVLGAVIALFKHDLKALLAFSTVSHLGLITMLLGTGTAFGAMAAVFHILNHATFKCALFMSAGIIDHGAHTRDIRRLGGLRKLMPVTFVIATLAALSMAGIPLLNGFLSKEMMLEEAHHTVLFGSHWLVPGLAVVGSLFSAAYCFRLIGHVFLGPVRDDYPAKPHDPGSWHVAATRVAGGAGGGHWCRAFPGRALRTYGDRGRSGRYCGHAQCASENLAWADTATIYVADCRYWRADTPVLLSPCLANLGHNTAPEAKTIFERGVIAGAVNLSRRAILPLHDGAFSRYGAIMAVTVITAGLYAWSTGTLGAMTRAAQPAGVLPIAAG